MPKSFIGLAIAGVAGALLLGNPAIAQYTAPVGKPNFTAHMIVGGTDHTDSTQAWAGLQVRLELGWHTYWRSAGEAGAPPEFDWSQSTNIADVRVEWPAPRRFTDAGYVSIGYADEVLFPIKLRLKDPSAATHVNLKLALFVCSKTCTRSDLVFDADLAPGARFDHRLDLIGTWRAKVPRAPSPDLTISAIRLQATGRPQLDFLVASSSPLGTLDVFVDGDSAISGGKPTITPTADGSTAVSVPIDGIDSKNADKPLHITLVDGNRSAEVVLPTRATTASSAVVSPPITDAADSRLGALWGMLSVALLAGVILNFMPCVFPVLSLKLFSLVSHTSHEVGAVRARFAATAAGVIVSFLILAAVLATLKGIGAQIGWGIQFQQPLFLIGMAAVLVALGANLLGLYEFRLPWRLAGRFSQGGSGQSIASHFFNGFIMTLLATPCSAPFVGTAVGFALSQGTVEIMIIFATLGIGMASPYLLLAAAPQLARYFPRPGRWMLTIRHVAAVAMAGTALWLLTVLAEVSGVQTALLTGIFLGALVWLAALHRQRFAHTVAGSLIGILAITAFLLAGERSNAPAAPNTDEPVAWQKFDPQRIQTMVASGKTVFVDVTAAWCVTCKVNKALILDSAQIRQRLGTDVAATQGDWTRPDPTISAYLQSFGRFGLPFNVVYGPGAPAGIVLPELLTQEAVLHAFDSASAKPSTN